MKILFPSHMPCLRLMAHELRSLFFHVALRPTLALRSRISRMPMKVNVFYIVCMLLYVRLVPLLCRAVNSSTPASALILQIEYLLFSAVTCNATRYC